MPNHEESTSVSPATIRERLEWLARLTCPLMIGGYIHLRILRSLSDDDLAPWQPFQWSELIRGNFGTLDINLLAHNALSFNIVTKGMASVLALIGSLYFADYATTGRRRGYLVLASPFGKSFRRRMRFWLLLWGLYVVAVTTAFTLVMRQQINLIATFQLLMIGHVLVTLTLLIANDGFEGFLLLLPEVRARRERKRRHRAKVREERRQRRQREEEEARRCDDAIRERNEQLSRLQMSCNEIEQEIEVLEASDEPGDVVAQQIGELNADRADLLRQIQHIHATGGTR
jgi:hypothetical protein